MNENEKKTDARAPIRMQAPLGERQTVTELSEDFTLPDYQPEIKRLLRVRANVQPPEIYIGAGNVECSGTVDYTVLYSGNDGALYCTDQSGEYRFSFPVELPADFDAGESVLCDVESLPETVTGRVSAPRKLTLRCRLRSRAHLFGTRVLPDPVEPSPGIQRLSGTCESAHVFLGMGEPLTLGDEILCDPQDSDVRVICADAQVFVTEAGAGSGTVNCRGELCLKLLCCHDTTGETYPMLRRIPFSQAVEADGVEVNCDCSAHGSAQDLRITVEDGRIQCEATVHLQVRAQRNETIALTRDAYSTASECITAYQDLTVPTALRCVGGNFSLGTAFPLEEVGIRAGLRPVDMDGSVTMGDAEYDRGKYYLNGKCRFHVILAGEDDWSAQEIEVPFRYETDGLRDALPVSSAELNANLISCRARIDGERIGIDAEIAVSGALRGERNVRVLSDCRMGEKWQAPGAVFTVCYPEKEDTLWSVARRYHRPVSELAAKNALAPSPAADAKDSLAGVRYLII